ncbi:hypothetical protein [Shewanella chilikensis]|uniref:hypothetical protein n=1 Tax=Shewanella chilikensis TaxID=558541 RepID=UPI001CD2C863|nr:hypothetical protein [Shewanella chilikensis]MCA0952163.1 hypothetical protein [Shewanella chilikensis]
MLLSLLLAAFIILLALAIESWPRIRSKAREHRQGAAWVQENHSRASGREQQDCFADLSFAPFLLTAALTLIACAFELMPATYVFGLILFIVLNLLLLMVWHLYDRLLGGQKSGQSFLPPLLYGLAALFAWIGAMP